ncbi:MAG: nucleoid-associated protein [Terriglobales bacterium]
MITNDDLATTVIRHVIFHDVPQKIREGDAKPQLSDVETKVDASQKGHLKTKLTRVLNSTKAYPIQFLATTASPVPKQVRQLTKSGYRAENFIDASRELANYLFEQHTGAISPGLLCVIDAAASGHPCLILMKLERERGAQLELSGAPGHRTFAMSVLNDLVLTDGTRLFKSAMFIRTGAGDDDFRASACDNQYNVLSADDLAKFWMRFLGCGFLLEPRVATQRFFESALSFISTAVTEPTVKSDIYDHLPSQMKSKAKDFAPKTFIQEFVPEEYQEQFREHLNVNNVPLSAFKKDIADIESKLQRRAYQTTKGGMISVPAEIADIVVIRPEDILVKDTVAKVK